MDSNHLKIVIIVILVLGFVRCTRNMQQGHERSDTMQGFFLQR